MEIGARVPLPQLESAMQDWFRRKNYIDKEDELKIAEIVPAIKVAR